MEILGRLDNPTLQGDWHILLGCCCNSADQLITGQVQIYEYRMRFTIGLCDTKGMH
jgi:hypothetical protein